MIIYNDIQKKTKAANAIIAKEKSMLEDYLFIQNNLKDTIKIYLEEISNNFSDNEIFKNMLISSIEAASLQVSINTHDLENLINILDIISNRGDTLENDVEQYNLLFSKIEKNINFVNEIVQRTKKSIDQIASISQPEKKEKAKVKLETEDLKPVNIKTEKNKNTSNKLYPRDIKKISDSSSSDLLCFFPKTDNDILAISTIQDTYQILFAEDFATIFIEQENFNFTLKTIGVQISNTSNVLLISRKANGFFVITNMTIDVPDFISVSKITQNKTFLEFEISNSVLNISVKENQLTFLESSDELDIKISKKKMNISKVSDEDTDNSNVDDEDDYDEEEYEDEIDDVDIDDDDIDENEDEDIEEIKNVEKFKKAPIPSKSKAVKSQIISGKEPLSKASKNETEDLLKDNDTLIISEKDNQVILPYTIEEVEKLYEKNKKKYSSVEDLIKNEYIISTDNFKNPIKSRFREAYQLIKKREHGHLKEAVDLGFELMFQSNLNPAIIAACKSLKELDIYLDCLDDNELDKFSCFNIVYNVPPSKKK